MFSLSESIKFMVCTSAVDLRKGVDSLSRMVRSNSMIPTDGSVYVFMNRTRTRMKLLHWERGGYVIFYKRMEQGCISHTVFKSDIVIDITASKTINVDVAVSTTNGFVKAMFKNKILESGHNKMTIPALLRKSDVADIVTVSCKGERHSKLITVNSNE